MTRNMGKTSAFSKDICHRRQHVPLEPPVIHMSMYVRGGLHRLFRQIAHPEKVSFPMYVYGEFTDESGHFRPLRGVVMASRYRVKDVINRQGQSAVLVLAEDLFCQKRHVVIKVLHASRYQLGAQETSCLWRLALADPAGNSNTVRYLNTFTFDDHFCLVFKPLVPLALTDIFHAIPAEKVIPSIRKIAVRLLSTLGFLRQQNVIHADLKPENILLSDRDDLSSVTVIDFGNAIQHMHKEIALYYDDFELQTPLYRAPEVMFGMPFGKEIDMWSLGCILAELYLSKPLFMGNSKIDIMKKITNLLGPFPAETFQRGKFYHSFTQYTGAVEQPDAIGSLMNRLGSRHYLLADFLAGLLRYNPDERMTPFEAAKHSFLAPEFPFGYLLPPSSDGCVSYPAVHLTSAKYKHRPAIAADIRRSQPSTYDLLHMGTTLRDQAKKSQENGVQHQRHDRIATVNPVQRGSSPSKRLQGTTEQDDGGARRDSHREWLHDRSNDRREMMENSQYESQRQPSDGHNWPVEIPPRESMTGDSRSPKEIPPRESIQVDTRCRDLHHIESLVRDGRPGDDLERETLKKDRRPRKSIPRESLDGDTKPMEFIQRDSLVGGTRPGKIERDGRPENVPRRETFVGDKRYWDIPQRESLEGGTVSMEFIHRDSLAVDRSPGNIPQKETSNGDMFVDVPRKESLKKDKKPEEHFQRKSLEGDTRCNREVLQRESGGTRNREVPEKKSLRGYQRSEDIRPGESLEGERMSVNNFHDRKSLKGDKRLREFPQRKYLKEDRMSTEVLQRESFERQTRPRKVTHGTESLEGNRIHRKDSQSESLERDGSGNALRRESLKKDRRLRESLEGNRIALDVTHRESFEEDKMPKKVSRGEYEKEERRLQVIIQRESLEGEIPRNVNENLEEDGPKDITSIPSAHSAVICRRIKDSIQQDSSPAKQSRQIYASHRQQLPIVRNQVAKDIVLQSACEGRWRVSPLATNTAVLEDSSPENSPVKRNRKGSERNWRETATMARKMKTCSVEKKRRNVIYGKESSVKEHMWSPNSYRHTGNQDANQNNPASKNSVGREVIKVESDGRRIQDDDVSSIEQSEQECIPNGMNRTFVIERDGSTCTSSDNLGFHIHNKLTRQTSNVSSHKIIRPHARWFSKNVDSLNDDSNIFQTIANNTSEFKVKESELQSFDKFVGDKFPNEPVVPTTTKHMKYSKQQHEACDRIDNSVVHKSDRNSVDWDSLPNLVTDTVNKICEYQGMDSVGKGCNPKAQESGITNHYSRHTDGLQKICPNKPWNSQIQQTSGYDHTELHQQTTGNVIVQQNHRQDLVSRVQDQVSRVPRSPCRNPHSPASASRVHEDTMACGSSSSNCDMHEKGRRQSTHDIASLMNAIKEQQALVEQDLCQKEKDRQIGYQVRQNSSRGQEGFKTGEVRGRDTMTSLTYETVSEDDFLSCDEQSLTKNHVSCNKHKLSSGDESYDSAAGDKSEVSQKFLIKENPGHEELKDLKYDNPLSEERSQHWRQRPVQGSVSLPKIKEELWNAQKTSSRVAASGESSEDVKSVKIQNGAVKLVNKSRDKILQNESLDDMSQIVYSRAIVSRGNDQDDQHYRSVKADGNRNVDKAGEEKITNSEGKYINIPNSSTSKMPNDGEMEKFEPDKMESSEEVDALTGSEDAYDSGPCSIATRITGSGKKVPVDYITSCSHQMADAKETDSPSSFTCKDVPRSNVPIKKVTKRKLHFTQALKPRRNTKKKLRKVTQRKTMEVVITHQQNHQQNRKLQTNVYKEDPYHFSVTPEKLNSKTGNVCRVNSKSVFQNDTENKQNIRSETGISSKKKKVNTSNLLTCSYHPSDSEEDVDKAMDGKETEKKLSQNGLGCNAVKEIEKTTQRKKQSMREGVSDRLTTGVCSKKGTETEALSCTECQKDTARLKRKAQSVSRIEMKRLKQSTASDLDLGTSKSEDKAGTMNRLQENNVTSTGRLRVPGNSNSVITSGYDGNDDDEKDKQNYGNNRSVRGHQPVCYREITTYSAKRRKKASLTEQYDAHDRRTVEDCRRKNESDESESHTGDVIETKLSATGIVTKCCQLSPKELRMTRTQQTHPIGLDVMEKSSVISNSCRSKLVMIGKSRELSTGRLYIERHQSTSTMLGNNGNRFTFPQDAIEFSHLGHQNQCKRQETESDSDVNTFTLNEDQMSVDDEVHYNSSDSDEVMLV